MKSSQDASAESINMPQTNHPSPDGQVLQRQPRLSLLGRDQGPAEKDISPWKTKIRQAQRPTSLGRNHEPGVLDRQLYATVKETMLRNPERIPGDNAIWDVLADVVNDVPKPIERASSEGLRVAMHPSAPHASPHHWARHMSSSTARQSSEWETETLLDQNRGSLDLDMALYMYPCPFRKRNPARFNIRDHDVCARAPFDSILRLKHHIVAHHGRKATRHQCRRCKQQFETEWALEAHLLLPRDQMCDVNPSFYDNPEDGVIEETVRILAARHAPEKIWTWDGIWRLVFPSDLEVPDPDFQPVAELVEVEQAFDDGQDLLKESLREKLKLLVPGAINDDYLSFLTGQVELVFETHRVNVMKKSLARSCALASGQLPQETPPVEPPRKPNRRSRRSTLLQTLQRTAPDSTGGLASRRHSRTNNIIKRDTNRLSREQFRLCTMEPHTTNTSIPIQPIDPRTPANPKTPHCISDAVTNPRDSRDSGIAMPCETCDAEPCHCSQAASEPSSCYTDDDDDGDEFEFAAHLTQRPQLGDPMVLSERRRQSRQPRLSIDTNMADVRLLNSCHFSAPERGGGRASGGLELDLRGSASAGVGGGVGVDSGGRFSPESFKQRVLRRQLGPELGPVGV